MAGTFRLTMQQGPTPGKSYEITKDVMTLGRDVSNDIVINDAEISRHHARFTRQGDGYAVEDLGSTNGTFVNGMRLTGPRALSQGDVLAMGETVLFGYEAIPAGAEATVAAAPPAPVVSPPAPVLPPTSSSPADIPPPPEPVEDGGGRTRAIALGCGCLTIVGCLAGLAAAAFYIDSNNLYCSIAPLLFPGC